MDPVDPRRLTREQILASADRFRDDVARAPTVDGRRFGIPVAKRIIPAEDAFKTLQAEMEAFESKLDADHEIALRIFGGSSLIHVKTIRYAAPDVLLFEGVTPEGDETLAVQHVAQLNLQLVKVPRLQLTAFRVGFVLPQE